MKKKILFIGIFIFYTSNVFAETNCDFFLSGGIGYLLNEAFKIMCYVAVILTVVLTIFDFVKKITNNEEIKSLVNKTFLRIIYTVVLFFLPIIVNAFFNTVLFDRNQTCITSDGIETRFNEVVLNLDKKSCTKGSLNIEIRSLDPDFDYFLLPNGNKIFENKYLYNVNTNGTYKFISYSKTRDPKAKSIEVTNIDTQMPSGSCTYYTLNNQTVVDVIANDDCKISGYKANGKNYNSRKIYLNEPLVDSSLVVFDEVGNETTIKCTKTEINTSGYTNEKVYKNSKTNITYNLYYQSDSRWADLRFSDGTMKEMGCHNVSGAVIASSYNKSITPKTVFETHSGDYPATTINDLTNNAYTCTVQTGNLDGKAEYIKQSLAKGNVFTIMVYGKNKGGSNIMVPGQHYMALIDIDTLTNKIFVGNSFDGTYGNSGWYDANTVLKSIREIDECIPSAQLK